MTAIRLTIALILSVWVGIFAVVPVWAQDWTAIRAAAETGDAQAQYKLARAFESGKGQVQDDFEAVRWLRAAAENGHPAAALDLGWMLANGYGVAKDGEQAYFWFLKAEALGAEGAVAQRTAMAATLEPDIRQRIAQDAGIVPGSLSGVAATGAASETGIGDPVLLPEDTYEAVRDRLNAGAGLDQLAKLRLLAEDGDARARNLYGLALRRSIDAADRSLGRQWLLLAAEDGLPAAQYNLASALLEDGDPRLGGSVDVAAVFAWLDRARSGSVPADPNDYTAIAAEFAARAGIRDPYRAAVQGSRGAFPELRELIRLKRQELTARQDLTRRLVSPPAATDSGQIETTIIE
ncbi:sel1 repeat family protein [Rhodospirillaceae bacterium KN72]|uniref:Sel1 repeat family protein n=1 Tax=Pacificispira spongiicola TaxID=2729598 RepID=A0A7Y0E012_9PROT|nr:tetratricopeptide repeat protein [Pacificispira spongiicola]NMM44714.1 sel1 repeat family protein [Pacificispira spongiicola]